MKFVKLQPGMTVFEVSRRKAGNTALSTVGTWQVHIISVDRERRCVVASWNGNKPSTYYEHHIGKWREKKPLLVSAGFGTWRLATRAEIAAAKAKDAENGV